MTSARLARALSLAGTGDRWPAVLFVVASVAALALAPWERGAPLPSRILYWAVLSTAIVMGMAAWVRWLPAAGRSGYWTCLARIPYLGGLALLGSLLLRRRPSPANRFAPARRYKFGLACLVLLGALGLSRAVWTPHSVAANDMAPSLVPGDYILAWRLGPWSRGDVVVITHPVTGTDDVKRIIALPGERFAMANGRPVLNGVEVSYRVLTDPPDCPKNTGSWAIPCPRAAAVETLPGGSADAVLDLFDGPYDTLTKVTMPEDHVIVLGDNRDNSADSRATSGPGPTGPVPLANIRSRVERVVLNTRDPARLWRPVP